MTEREPASYDGHPWVLTEFLEFLKLAEVIHLDDHRPIEVEEPPLEAA